MGRDTHDLYEYSITLYLVERPKLPVEPGRSMTLPFARMRFIVKPLDQPQTIRPRNCHDVLPLLVSLQDIEGETPKLSSDTIVFVNLQHTL